MKPALQANQKTGTRKVCKNGIAQITARTRAPTPKIGMVRRSRRRAGCAAWKKNTSAAPRNTIVGTQSEYGAGKRGCHPPRKSNVATHEIVTMLAYSDMKKQA